MRPSLIFVYNADSGVFNTLTDIAHKVFSPDTYSCNLCAITHGTFAMRAEWKQFLESLDAEMEFLHRDELEAAYGLTDIALPAILIKYPAGPELWISADQINACHNMADLKALITGRIGA